MFIEIFIVVALTLLNGVLAMSELAVVSSRPARLRVLADQGRVGAQIAIRLREDPSRFLSTVQIGITLVGVLSGAFSGATLGARFSGWLEEQGVGEGLADGLGVGSVVVAITYLSLMVGELVPKQIALRNPEVVAVRIAGPMRVLSRVAAPLVWLLDRSGKIILTLLGQSGTIAGSVTDEEIKSVLNEARNAGVIETEEQAMISGVMRLADRTARGLMTPRRDVDTIDADTKLDVLKAKLHETQRSRLPVLDRSSDEIIGILSVKAVYDTMLAGDTVDIRQLMMSPPIVSDFAPAVDVINAMRDSSTHMALVYDEHGHFEGLISSGDILEAITGAFAEDDNVEPTMMLRDDGSYLVAGWTPIDEFADTIGFSVDDDVDFTTVAGMVIAELRHIPELGEAFRKHGWRFEVADLDGRRVDKVIVSRAPEDEDQSAII